ncbi:hypothetical protein [Euzebya sp.]|uniref:hypothetical protein n=1 Tax=Euzebya sp. TaxID=1971409 RepID=UPI0035119599
MSSPRPSNSSKRSGSQVQLLARVDELARREGLIAADTAKARIYRDRIGGTVMWLPHGQGRLELTLIQVRMASEQRADLLHELLARCAAKSTEDIPAHELGLSADDACAHWATLEREFFGEYLMAHREVQAGHGPRSA